MLVPTVCRNLQQKTGLIIFLAGCCLLFAGVLGCQTPAARKPAAEDMIPPLLELAPGDTVEITFPGATNLTGMHRIGPEGFITMPLVGKVMAGGKTAQELQNDLTKKYETELQDKEVIVTVVNSANAVYVTGAVLRPGKLQLDRPLTALEAIMEVGGFSDTANRKEITVVRYEGEQNVVYHLDLEKLLVGGPVAPFYVHPRDIIHVPQKVQWF